MFSSLPDPRVIRWTSFLKTLSALLVILKLVETGAGRGQKHDVARFGSLRAAISTARSRVPARSIATLPVICDSIFSAAAPIRRARIAFSRRGFLQDRVVAAFVFAAQNNQDAAGKSIECFQCRVHIGGLGIVEVAHAANLGYKFQPMLHALETANGLANGFRRQRRPGGPR